LKQIRENCIKMSEKESKIEDKESDEILYLKGEIASNFEILKFINDMDDE